MPERTIHTVAGNIRPEELGVTQCHEHLYLKKGQSFLCDPNLCIDDVEKSVAETAAYLNSGGRSVVDAQPVGCGRSASVLTEISRRTGVHIVASTGFHKLRFYPEDHWIRRLPEEKLKDLFVHELSAGMTDGPDGALPETGHAAGQLKPAGIIKTALDACGLEGRYGELFSAAAEAQRVTGAPMQVHIEKGSAPEKLADYLLDGGILPSSLYFCHMDRAFGGYEPLRYVLEAGISLEFDTIGRFKYHSDEEEIALIQKVLADGWEDSLLFSLDTTRARLKAFDPDAVGLNYILEVFIPKLRKAGISDGIIRKIMVENPARILAW